MINFKQFLTESVRVGLPHITTMKHSDFHNLIKTGKVHIEGPTEKTDGQTFKMGHDEHGFYTQHSGSGDEKIRTGEGHIERAKRRATETNKPYDSKAPKAFAKFHNDLASNKALQQHLKNEYHSKGREVVVKGEAFNKHLAQDHNAKKGTIRFVGSTYDTSHMGSTGKFVIHSKLPENKQHDLEHFKTHLSSSKINFDDDKTTHTPTHIDVAHEKHQFDSLNHSLINSRTVPKIKAAKLEEVGKMQAIQKSVSDKVDQHIHQSGITPKWGPDTEGLVVHPSEHNPEAPRFKVTSSAFRKFKADPSSKFKKGK